MLEKESLVNQFQSLGICDGDVVLIRAALSKVGVLSGGPSIVLEALKEAVGKSGTVVALGFSKLYFRSNMNPEYAFTSDAPSNAGAIAKIFMRDGDCERSCHPTNSFLAIGPEASSILAAHDAKSKSYSPMNQLLKLDAKMVVIGCVGSSPGFTTVHLAQENLGLTSKSWFSGLFGQYYYSEGKCTRYIKKDFGGCSAGFNKFYHEYLAKECLRIGYVGEAYSMAINCRDAYDIEYIKLKENNTYHLCDNPRCISCRVSWKNNLGGIPKFLYASFINILKQKILRSW